MAGDILPSADACGPGKVLLKGSSLIAALDVPQRLGLNSVWVRSDVEDRLPQWPKEAWPSACGSEQTNNGYDAFFPVDGVRPFRNSLRWVNSRAAGA